MQHSLSPKSLAVLGLTIAFCAPGYAHPSSPANEDVQSSQQTAETHTHPAVQHAFAPAGEPPLTQSLQDVRYQELTEATQNFSSLLDETQRAAVVVPFEDPFRTRAFCYVLARCNNDYVGLRLSALNPAQKIALNNLLMKSFSGAGYSRAIQTMNREWL
ncbi:MAG: DUF3500 domain-containing protein, partial [Phormidesmis sp.]